MESFKKQILSWMDNGTFTSSILRKLGIRDSREHKRPNRIIYINNTRVGSNKDQEPIHYCSNRVKTSKYTWWNFIPKNLFEQMRRIANFYFVINAIFIFLVPDPPTSPYAFAVPIALVLIVTALKQGYEDILRHLADRKLNQMKTKVLRNGQLQIMNWQDIKVGDIVEVSVDQPFPCDLLLLASVSNQTGLCFITTANLDGETNLKKKWAPVHMPRLNNVFELGDLQGIIECDKPNMNLHEFKGRIFMDNKEIYVTNDNILLRGCLLKVTQRVYGCAIYTGQDTKLSLNTKFTRNKLSSIERRLNYLVLICLIILVVLVLFCFLASFAYDYLYEDVWYMFGREPAYFEKSRGFSKYILLITYLNFFHYIVPLSMYVTIELQRFVGSKFINWDVNLYDPKTDQPAQVNATDLNEDLGQVEYLFCDKTGTLTDNEMLFKQFSINGMIYEEANGQIRQIETNQSIEHFRSELFEKFFQVLSLCHSVQVDRSMKEMYQASSPDEFSFLKFCSKVGVVYDGEMKYATLRVDAPSNFIRTVRINNQPYDYELLNVLEFDSNRRRMSVIVRDLQINRIMVLCKGAESSVFKCCTTGDIAKCDADVKHFAEQGWRTLAVAYKEISDQEYEEARAKLESALTTIRMRNTILAKVFDEIESDLELIGATAVEDKLQEGVPETIEFLRQGGIKVWILTGDKKETAVNISNSCRHFTNDMVKLDLTDLNQFDQIEIRIVFYRNQMNNFPNDKYAVIVDGQALNVIFHHRQLTMEFQSICLDSAAVLCCRMSPSQKASVVRLIKNSKDKPLTAAIGDGANDVSMIQEAHMGLGIFGKEGRQAARAADIAFSKFRFIKRVLFVHGYLFYTRISSMIHYFFYKNFAFVICQFYYSFSTGFSVTSLYNSINLSLFNTLFTSIPVLFYGWFEQKMPIKKLETYPYLYKTIANNYLLRYSEFLKWSMLALWHSLICYFYSYVFYEPSTPMTSDGKLLNDNNSFGCLVFTLIIMVVHIKLFIEWEHKDITLFISFSLSLILYILFAIIPNTVTVGRLISLLTDGQSLFWAYTSLYERFPVWLFFLITCTSAIFPDMLMSLFDKVRTAYFYDEDEWNQIQKMMNEERLRREHTGRLHMNNMPSYTNSDIDQLAGREFESGQDYTADTNDTEFQGYEENTNEYDDPEQMNRQHSTSYV